MVRKKWNFTMLRLSKLEEAEIKRLNCPHKHILFGEVCLDCGKDMWG